MRASLLFWRNMNQLPECNCQCRLVANKQMPVPLEEGRVFPISSLQTCPAGIRVQQSWCWPRSAARFILSWTWWVSASRFITVLHSSGHYNVSGGVTIPTVLHSNGHYSVFGGGHDTDRPSVQRLFGHTGVGLWMCRGGGCSCVGVGLWLCRGGFV